MIINCLKAFRIHLVKNLSHNFSKQSLVLERAPPLRHVLTENLEYYNKNKTNLSDLMNILKFNSWTLR
jgi:hypothetical protein